MEQILVLAPALTPAGVTEQVGEGRGQFEIPKLSGRFAPAIESHLRKLLESHHAPVAQMDRALVSGTKGRRFESSQAYYLFLSRLS